jgi:hypothetical protein
MSNDLNDYLNQLESLEKQKQGIIEKLLAERAKIDEQLEKLGYAENNRIAKKGGRPKGKKDSAKRTRKPANAGE